MEVGKSARDIIKQLYEWNKIDVLEGYVQKDHVHLVLTIPPKCSVSEIVDFLKNNSAIKMLDNYLDLKKRYRNKHFWAKRYCVSTVGLDGVQIRKYVKTNLLH
tara:strand:- start:102 stop:410 length:309 start_codon:yes stop_codon:yes gene_type:complete